MTATYQIRVASRFASFLRTRLQCGTPFFCKEKVEIKINEKKKKKSKKNENQK